MPSDLIRKIANYLDVLTKRRLHCVCERWSLEFEQACITSPLIINSAQFPPSTISTLTDLYDLKVNTKVVRNKLKNDVEKHKSTTLVIYCPSTAKNNTISPAEQRQLGWHVHLFAHFIRRKLLLNFPKIVFDGGLLKGDDLFEFFLQLKTGSTVINRQMAVLAPLWIPSDNSDGLDSQRMIIFGKKEQKVTVTQDPMLSALCHCSMGLFEAGRYIEDGGESSIREGLEGVFPQLNSQDFIMFEIFEEFDYILGSPLCMPWLQELEE